MNYNFIFFIPLSPFLEKYKAFLVNNFEATVWEVADEKEYLQTVPMLENSITFTEDLKKTLSYLVLSQQVVKNSICKNILFNEGTPPPHILKKLQGMGLDDAWNREYEDEEMRDKVEMFYQGYNDSEIDLKPLSQSTEVEGFKLKKIKTYFSEPEKQNQKVKSMLLTENETDNSNYNFVPSSAKLNILEKKESKKNKLKIINHPLTPKKKFTLNLLNEAQKKGSHFIPLTGDNFYRLRTLTPIAAQEKKRKARREEYLRLSSYKDKVTAYKKRFEVDEYTDNVLEKSLETILELEEDRSELFVIDSGDLEFLVFFIELYQKKEVSKEVIIKIASELMFKKYKAYSVFYTVSEKPSLSFPKEVIEAMIEREENTRLNLKNYDLRIPHFKDETFTQQDNEFYYPYYLNNKLLALGVSFFTDPPDLKAKKTTEAFFLILRSLFI